MVVDKELLFSVQIHSILDATGLSGRSRPFNLLHPCDNELLLEYDRTTAVEPEEHDPSEYQTTLAMFSFSSMKTKVDSIEKIK